MFTAYSEKDAATASRRLLEPGVYPFTIHAATDKNKDGTQLRSKKSGAAMIHVKLHVHREDGGVQFVDCYITDAKNMAYLARGLAATTNTLAEYTEARWGADTITGKDGWVQIGVESEKDKGDGSGEKWPAKNTVKAFGKPEPKGGASAPAAAPSRPQPTEAQMANQTGGAGDPDVPFARMDFACQ